MLAIGEETAVQAVVSSINIEFPGSILEWEPDHNTRELLNTKGDLKGVASIESKQCICTAVPMISSLGRSLTIF